MNVGAVEGATYGISDENPPIVAVEPGTSVEPVPQAARRRAPANPAVIRNRYM